MFSLDQSIVCLRHKLQENGAIGLKCFLPKTNLESESALRSDSFGPQRACVAVACLSSVYVLVKLSDGMRQGREC